MRKTAVTLTVSTLVLGIFGAFLRWLQTMNAVDQDTGYMIPGAGTTIVFVGYSVLVVVVILLLNLFWISRYGSARDAGKALRCESVIPLVLAWVFCVAFAAAAFVLLFAAGQSRYPLWQRLFGAAGILAGLSFPFLFGKKGGSGAGTMGLGASIIITLFYCFWMLFCYKLHSEDPIIWHFAVEILAVAGGTVAFYQVARYFFRAGSGRNPLIAVQLGVYLNVATLFEERGTAWNVMLGVTAAMLLLLEFLLIANLWEKRDGE